ncbi:hypothetical protein LJD47_28680, partial [Escherichia coli]|nr:hypothetical protein [Escherichia coli]
KQLDQIFASARSLLFTSQMDNAPLTIIEALSTGCYVVAYPSPAAAEMLAMVGGRCAASPSEAETLVLESRESELYGGISPDKLAERARHLFSGNQLLERYSALYTKLIVDAKGMLKA